MSLLTPLLTDLYQLTMGYGYWREGMAERRAVFHLFFRRAPFGGEVAVAAGLELIDEFLNNFSFTQEDLDYLGSLDQPHGEPLFPQPYLEFLRGLHLSVDIDAVPEGSAIFPFEPILRVEGPLLQCQLLETTLLNSIGFQTLVATKSARICAAAGSVPVLEFGLRRAQGPDGALQASRAAYLGGCHATSNVLAGRRWGIPVRGTHSHSWVLSFDDELEAFHSYAESYPKGTILLIDTYDVDVGIRNALAVAKSLKEAGETLVGVRIDSGDIAEISRTLRGTLDGHGFPSIQIIASGDIDEWKIKKIRDKGGAVDAWGVGTKLVTAYDQPALDVVYKLSGVEDANGMWQWRAKRSASGKISLPGRLGVKRFIGKEGYLFDLLYDGNEAIHQGVTREGELRDLTMNAAVHDLLVPFYRQGRCVSRPDSLHKARRRWEEERAQLPKRLLSLNDAEHYDVLLTPGLYRQTLSKGA